MRKKPSVLVVPDSFKNSLSAAQVAESLANGFHFFKDELNIKILPFSDGGEGSLETIAPFISAEEKENFTFDPFMKAIRASYLFDGVSKTAYIESARVIGLEILDRSPDCFYSSSYGLGVLIENALKHGAENILIFLGGSATCDGGVGMAAALGVKFYAGERMIERPLAKDMSVLTKIEFNGLLERLKNVNFTMACDVTNPFYGPNGAAHVYAAQKGANKKQIMKLDKGLQNLAEYFLSKFKIDLQSDLGSGAAGGLGGAGKVFLRADLKSGFDIISAIGKLEENIKNCDFVVTGEGQIDHQSFQGKLIHRIKILSDKYQKPVALVGALSEIDEETAKQKGFHSLKRLYSTPPKKIDEEETKKRLFKVAKKWALHLTSELD